MKNKGFAIVGRLVFCGKGVDDGWVDRLEKSADVNGEQSFLSVPVSNEVDGVVHGLHLFHFVYLQSHQFDFDHIQDVALTGLVPSGLLWHHLPLSSFLHSSLVLAGQGFREAKNQIVSDVHD